MKILLVALNSKYSHTNLAIRYLKNYVRDIEWAEISLAEFTINQSDEYILWEIFEKKPDMVCFSCYIWNIEKILFLSEFIKKSNDEIKIILGGPEVSFETEELMNEYKSIDVIVRGEGEETFREYLNMISKETNCNNLEGITYRSSEKAMFNEDRKSKLKMDDLIYPYANDDFDNKYIYYESSRGCPFNCSFCISSCEKGVKSLSIERIKEDILKLLDTNAKTIKFVDRTFNYDKERAIEIIRYIVANNSKNKKIHFELTAEIMDEKILTEISKLPVDMFQFEIGIQSTHRETLDSVNRKSDFQKLKTIVERLVSGKNVHLHVDLIAGLPFESYEDFSQSFNDVFFLGADKIQIGFLKVLKGTKIRENAKKFGLKYSSKAPYEIIKNNHISHIELLKIKKIENIVESYYNEHYFKNAIKTISDFESPFKFFECFSGYWVENRLFDKYHKRTELYWFLYNFVMEKYNKDLSKELLDDFIYSNKNQEIPKYLYSEEEKGFMHLKHLILKRRELLEYCFEYLKKIPNKKILNEFRVLRIEDKWYVYVYGNKDNIFERCKKIDISEYIKGEEDGL